MHSRTAHIYLFIYLFELQTTETRVIERLTFENILNSILQKRNITTIDALISLPGND